MLKAYLHSTEPNTTDKSKQDYLFTPEAAKAAHYATKQEVDDECTILNRLTVEIASGAGQRFYCSNFQVEERTPDEWIIFCEVPFWPTTAGPDGNRGLDRFVKLPKR